MQLELLVNLLTFTFVLESLNMQIVLKKRQDNKMLSKRSLQVILLRIVKRKIYL